MKRIKTIEELYRKAVERSGYEDIGYASTRRFGHPVYEVLINWDTDEAVLRHYGTVTILYNMRRKELLSWYGEGVSDRDSMNTFLRCIQEGRYFFRYGTRMGFVLQEGIETYEVNPECKNLQIRGW